jgi:hypothetical protein
MLIRSAIIPISISLDERLLHMFVYIYQVLYMYHLIYPLSCNEIKMSLLGHRLCHFVSRYR